MSSPVGKSRARKRHVQLELQRFDKNGQRRVGPHPRAGRPPKGKFAGSPHKRRDEVNPRHPQHVTLRVVSEVGFLRTRRLYRAIRRALVVSLARQDFRIVHHSVQRDHIHLICEAKDKLALARGLQGFQISAAKHINRMLRRRRGQVFADRYHVESITTPHQTRNALAYVLNNWRKHREDPRLGLFDGRIDRFSSAIWFDGFRERTVAPYVPDGADPPPQLPTPRTWLLAEGYKRAPAISVFGQPGSRRNKRRARAIA